MNCTAKWGTKRLFGHLGKLLIERKVFPNDGSVELELAECMNILKARGALV